MSGPMSGPMAKTPTNRRKTIAKVLPSWTLRLRVGGDGRRIEIGRRVVMQALHATFGQSLPSDRWWRSERWREQAMAHRPVLVASGSVHFPV